MRVAGPRVHHVSALYAGWVSTLEATISSHHGLPPSSVSRAADPRLREQQVQQAATFREAPLQDKVANWWSRVVQVLVKVTRHRERGNGARQLIYLRELGNRL
eukprot:6156135-Pyramimonas_sp.AAC.1